VQIEAPPLRIWLADLPPLVAGWLAVIALAACQRTEPARDRAAEPAAGELRALRDAGAATSAAPAVAPTPGGRATPALPDPLPGTRKDVTALVGGASRVAIGDLDGDGRRELVLADARRLRVVTPAGREVASTEVAGGIQVLVTTDLDGDGRAEILAGWGTSRDFRDAKARVTLYRLDHGHLVEETVLVPDTSRQDIVAIVPMLDTRSILIAYFNSKYMVSTVVMHRGARGWDVAKIASIRTATSYARGDVDGDGKPELVVGRVYGDDKGVDGDAFVLAPDGTRTPLPTTRGLRALALADADGDGHPEIFMGDGWHQDYGQHARGLLTWVRHTRDGFQSELIEDTAGQYSIERLVPASIDGRTTIIANGSHYVRAFARIGDRWRGVTIAGLARDVAVGDLDGIPGDEIVVVGDHSAIISLRGLDWTR
jgi:hypothetical protein